MYAENIFVMCRKSESNCTWSDRATAHMLLLTGASLIYNSLFFS